MHLHVSAWPLVRVLNGLQHLSHDKYHGGQGKVRGKTVCFFLQGLSFQKGGSNFFFLQYFFRTNENFIQQLPSCLLAWITKVVWLSNLAMKCYIQCLAQ